MRADLDHLLLPLERTQDVHLAALSSGRVVIDAAHLDPEDGPAPGVLPVLEAALRSGRRRALQYTPPAGRPGPRRAVADALRARHGAPYSFRDICLTAGATAALHVAIRSVTDGDAEVVVPVPCWIDHMLYVAVQGATPVTVPLASGDFRLDVPALVQRIGSRTRAVLLTNPGNPSGTAVSRADLEALGTALQDAEAVTGLPITVISDETHCDHVPAASFCPASEVIARCLTVHSFGKINRLHGQRIGYVAVSPNHPEREAVQGDLVRWCRALAAVPTSLMQEALPGLLALEHDLGPIDERLVALRSGLEELGLDYSSSDGPPYTYVRRPSWAPDDAALVADLAARGLLVMPASVFGHEGWFRVSVTGSAAQVASTLEVLRDASQP